MEHWIEPAALGDFQRSGYGSPTVNVSELRNGGAWTPPQPGSSPLPDLPPPGVQHYVNRPGQLGAYAGGLTAKLPAFLAGAVFAIFAWPWVKKQLKKIG